jgi:hypothetical protein
VEQGRAAGDRLADQNADERPTAVFCANDLLMFEPELVIRESTAGRLPRP